MVSEEQIKALNTRKDELYKFIKINVKQSEADKLEVLSQKNDFLLMENARFSGNQFFQENIFLKKASTTTIFWKPQVVTIGGVFH